MFATVMFGTGMRETVMFEAFMFETVMIETVMSETVISNAFGSCQLRSCILCLSIVHYRPCILHLYTVYICSNYVFAFVLCFYCPYWPSIVIVLTLSAICTLFKEEAITRSLAGSHTGRIFVLRDRKSARKLEPCRTKL